MNEKTEILLKNYQPRLAIVAYTTTVDDSWRDAYLESHVINDKGQLMEGKPLLQETIQGIVDVFFDERQNTSRIGGFLPSNVLQYELLPGGNYSLMWWQPAQIKQIFFTDALKIKSGQAWVPAMLYKVERKDLYIYSLLKDERPDEKTVLFRSPFHNTANDGHVCLGSASVKKPKEMTFQTIIKYWEDLFWLSEFTHLNGATNPTKSDLSTLWRKMMKDKKLKWDKLKELKQMSPKATIKTLLDD